MKLAAQLYTIHDYTKTEADIERSLYKIKEIGYNAIQISAFGPYRTPWLADLLKKLELAVEQIRSHRDKLDRLVAALLERSHLNGGEIISVMDNT